SSAIRSYDVTRIEGTLDGTGTPSVQYLEVIEVTDIEEYRAVGNTPEFVNLLQEWATFVELDEALHGTVIVCPAAATGPANIAHTEQPVVVAATIPVETSVSIQVRRAGPSRWRRGGTAVTG
ncbi:hypothetical protein, partial [Pseudonocardia sp.]|uniref:hypothetical protein n=1 Tax=Pseudonocardia sp. TaxID=60912 RepID=UPI00263351DB